MRLGIAQMKPYLGRVDQNLQKHREWIQQAKQAQVDLLVFPELSLTGYFLLDLTYEVARHRRDEEIQDLVRMADGIDLAFGFVEESADHILYNAAIYASHQEIIHLHRKVYLPTYGMFDEARYFGQGKQIRSFATRFGQMGLLICEDAWHPSTSYLLSQDGAQILLMLANSPAKDVTAAEFDSQRTWHLLTHSQASMYGMYTIFAHRVGSEDGVSFFGGSHLVNPMGRKESEAPLFQEELLIADIDLSAVRRARLQTPMLRDENLDLTIRELKRIRRERYEGGSQR